MEIREPEITRDQILVLDDPSFISENVCIVTGVGGGIGRATAIACSVNGLHVLGLDINIEEAENTVKMANALGGKMSAMRVDLANDDDIIHAVDEASRIGAVRYLANIAGIQHIDSVENFPMEKYDLMQKIMLRAPFYLSKLTIPLMKKSSDGVGVVGNMSSVHGHICTMNKPVYNITKFGLRALSQSISAEGAGKIRSFSVSVGFVKTGLALKQVPAQAAQRGISHEEVVRDVMMGKSQVKEMMSPVDVGNIFVIGFSRYSNYLVGGDLLFDGGMVLTY